MLLARASGGMLLWAFGFCLLYALHGLGCASAWDGVPLLGGSLFRWILDVVWLCLGCGGVAIIRWAAARPAGFERTLTAASGVTGLAGTIVTGSPIVLISSCL